MTMVAPLRPTARRAAELRPVLAPVRADVPDAELSLEELGSRIVGMAGRLAAATCRWLLLVADFDRREGCAGFGLPTTARWLSHCCGLAHRTAVEHVRVARALSSFPALVEEMSSGRLSYSHVRAISRLAHDGEQRLVTELIDVAENGTVGQLETVVRGLRTVEGNDGSSGSDRPEEYVRHSWTSTSQSNLTARLDPSTARWCARRSKPSPEPRASTPRRRWYGWPSWRSPR